MNVPTNGSNICSFNFEQNLYLDNISNSNYQRAEVTFIQSHICLTLQGVKAEEGLLGQVMVRELRMRPQGCSAGEGDVAGGVSGGGFVGGGYGEGTGSETGGQSGVG